MWGVTTDQAGWGDPPRPPAPSWQDRLLCDDEYPPCLHDVDGGTTKSLRVAFQMYIKKYRIVLVLLFIMHRTGALTLISLWGSAGGTVLQVELEVATIHKTLCNQRTSSYEINERSAPPPAGPRRLACQCKSAVEVIRARGPEAKSDSDSDSGSGSTRDVRIDSILLSRDMLHRLKQSRANGSTRRHPVNIIYSTQ
ncbi:hypothetical protein FB451DRAFT_1378529 [Mycena latifolia]|nr:hypothetical protein FB451DRAFT_1378529 [Mycena latifolia]